MGWKNKKFLAISLAIPALTYLLVVFFGELRGFEYKIYDFYLRLRPPQSTAPRIVIVGITEEDLDSLDQTNIDDGTLVKVIKKIKTRNPRVIGLDLHRNVPVCFVANSCESDKLQLSELFENTPNLIGIEKTTGGNQLADKPILPNPVLASKGRTGASEIIQDSDNVIRRAYLYVQKSEKVPFASFGLRLALKYLEEESVTPTDYKTWLKLNNAVFPEIESVTIKSKGTEENSFFDNLKARLNNFKNQFKEVNKFYPRHAIDGYQILLNYRANRNLFETISILDLLEDKSLATSLEDKIVLIGRLDELSKDIYTVPHIKEVRKPSDRSFGVIIHAQLTSYLIEAALQERTVSKLLPNSLGIVLVIILLLEPPLLMNWLAKKKQKAFSLIILASCQLLFILSFGGLSLFLLGYWIPVVDLGVTTCVIIATLAFLIYEYRHEQQRLQLEQIIEQKNQDLKLAYKKIIASEKIFTYQGLAQVISHELKNKTNVIQSSAQKDCQNLILLRQIIEEYPHLYEDYEEKDYNNPLYLCDLSLKNTESILQSVKKTSLILEELQLDSGRDNLEITKINLNESLRITINELAQTKPIEYLEVNVNYDDRLPELMGIKQHIERALENIISNSFDSLLLKSTTSIMHTPILNITTIDRGDYIEISIRDNGKGISTEYFKDIFQIHWTNKIETGGKGLGLFFAQEFIHEHGGEIDVKSQLGEYAEFIIRLPLKQNISPSFNL